jgi:hypothetical protein
MKTRLQYIRNIFFAVLILSVVHVEDILVPGRARMVMYRVPVSIVTNYLWGADWEQIVREQESGT